MSPHNEAYGLPQIQVDVGPPKPEHDATINPKCSKLPIANNCMVRILGATGSGKSYILKHISMIIPYDIIIFISPTALLDQTFDEDALQCKYLMYHTSVFSGVHAANTYFDKRIKIKTLTNEYEELLKIERKGGIVSKFKLQQIVDDLEELIGENDVEMYDMDKSLALVLDDCGYMTGDVKQKNSPLVKFILERRHKGASVFGCFQSCVQLDKDIRRNTTDDILTNKMTEDDIKAVYKDSTNIPYRDVINKPEYFNALLQGLHGDAKYSWIGLLKGGLYHDFEPVSKERVIEIIQKYNNLKKQLREKLKDSPHRG